MSVFYVLGLSEVTLVAHPSGNLDMWLGPPGAMIGLAASSMWLVREATLVHVTDGQAAPAMSWVGGVTMAHVMGG